jgi:gliding motility-associated-like protein
VVNNAACVNAPVNLSYTGTASPSANYNWVFNGGTVVSGTGAGPYSLTWSAQGNYQISLTVDENGCVSPQTDLQAIVNPLPSAFAGNDQLVCSGAPAPIGQPSVAGENYQWSPVMNLSDPTISNPVATPVNNSTATIQEPYLLFVTDANGCVNTDTVTVSSYPVPVINFNDPGPQCFENNNLLFSALANIPSGVNFNWTFSPEASLLSSSQQDVNVSYSTTGTFAVTLTADYNGCPAQSYTDSVTISDMPVSNFFPLVFNGCEPLTVPFNNISIGDGNTYTWDFGDGTIGSAPIASHVYQDAGIYSVSLQAVNKDGCASDTLFKNLIQVYALPQGQFVPNPQLANILAPVIQFQNYSTNAVYYNWSFGDGDTSGIWSPSHQYADTGNYSIILMLRSSEGCVDTITGVVRVEDNFSFYIPNTFTPNGDGINDEFRGYGVAIRKYQMNIYDRWGKLIFNTDNYDKAWDGKMKSGVIQNDTYVYRIQLVDHHNETHTYVGDISVIR